MAGIVLTSCCLSDDTCGVDGSNLNRSCMSYEELKKFFNFATPPATRCDGTAIGDVTPTAGAPAPAGAGG